MEFRILRQPGRESGSGDRPQTFGKRPPFQPDERRTSRKQMVEATALAIGVAALAFLVIDAL